ncbi:MAG: VTT domain-containing protein, partial [Armatimonadetes bacterium]|nr:VTT domain-containing protein [Armatimonadota bacterium]
MDFLHQLHNPEGVQQLIAAGGYLVLFAIIFAETGLLIGFFLPGDSLLFIAGFVAALGHLNIGILIFLLCIAAIVGDSVGYFIGRKAGPALFSRPDSRFFKRKHLESAHEFYEKHGPKTIVLARFVPIVR